MRFTAVCGTSRGISSRSSKPSTGLKSRPMRAGNVAVVDSWAILAFLRAEEPGAAAMRRYLRRAQAGNLRLLLNVVNLGEVFYRLLQLTTEEQADERLAQVKALPVDIVPARESLV